MGLAASAWHRLAHADFNALNEADARAVAALVTQVPLVLPQHPLRRTRVGLRGRTPHWPGAIALAARNGGEVLRVPRRQRQTQPLPLLVLLDVSASMARYARLLLAFLHAATQGQRVDVFAFGTALSDLTPAFAARDTDTLLRLANPLMTDFSGGTRIGESLATLRTQFAHRVVPRRSLVLLVTDGLDTGDAAQLAQELGWLRRQSRRVLWLNPLLRYASFTPTARGPAVLAGHTDGSLAVHSLHSLQQLARGVAQLLGTKL
jgi:uncharacterized protein with von Willebrand factor type A (vWA) domain